MTNTATLIGPTDIALWETLLWASLDDDGEPLEQRYSVGRFGSVGVDSAAIAKLSEEFWAWDAQACELMVDRGYGDLSLEDLVGEGRAEHCYVLVREGHGVGTADSWTAGSEQWFLCRELEKLARAQGEINAYVGDDGRVYTY